MLFNDLQLYTRQRTQTVNEPAITDSELQTYLNFSLAELDGIMVQDFEDYRLKRYLCSISGSSNTIPLPADFLKLRAVDFGTPGSWITLFGFSMLERNRFSNPIGNVFVPYGFQIARRVLVENNEILIEPQTVASGQYQIWYTPKYDVITDPASPLPIGMDTQSWIEYAVASTGVKIYTKLNLDSSAFERQMMFYKENVRNEAKNRMSMGSKAMVNTRHTSNWNLFGGGRYGM